MPLHNRTTHLLPVWILLASVALFFPIQFLTAQPSPSCNDDIVDQYVVDSFEYSECMDEDEFLELCEITSFCVEPMTYVNLETGYRWDKICNRAVLVGPDAGAFAATQLLSHLNSYQIGFKGQWSDYSWIVKGYYHTGWVSQGDYHEANFNGNSGGDTSDGSVALGYLYYSNSCWGAAFFGGWSYDELHLKAKNLLVTTTTEGIVPVGGIHCKNWIQGPWIGLDAIFQPNLCSRMTLGYELHHAHWHAHRFLEHGELGDAFGVVTGFSNRRAHHNLWGQVFQVEASYIVCKGYDVGFLLKYSSWQSAGNGKYVRTDVPLDPAINHHYINDVEWHSFSAMLRLGLVF